MHTVAASLLGFLAGVCVVSVIDRARSKPRAKVSYSTDRDINNACRTQDTSELKKQEQQWRKRLATTGKLDVCLVNWGFSKSARQFDWTNAYETAYLERILIANEKDARFPRGATPAQVCHALNETKPTLLWMKRQKHYIDHLPTFAREILKDYTYGGDQVLNDFLWQHYKISKDVARKMDQTVYIKFQTWFRMRVFNKTKYLLPYTFKSWPNQYQKHFLIMLVFVLNDIIQHAPALSKDVIVYRGIDEQVFPEEKIIQKAKKLGSLEQFMGFQSTSLDAGVGINFAGTKCCLFRIKIPKNSHVVFMEFVTGFHEEKEILLPALSSLEYSEHEAERHFVIPEFIGDCPIIPESAQRCNETKPPEGCLRVLYGTYARNITKMPPKMPPRPSYLQGVTFAILKKEMVKLDALNTSLAKTINRGTLSNFKNLFQNPFIDIQKAIQTSVRAKKWNMVKLIVVDGRTEKEEAFLWAIRERKIDFVKFLLQGNPSLVNPSFRENEAIGEAVSIDNVKVLDVLLKDARVDPTADDNSALYSAILSGHKAIVARLLQDDRIDPRNLMAGLNAITLAYQSNHDDIVALLKKDGRVKEESLPNSKHCTKKESE